MPPTLLQPSQAALFAQRHSSRDRLPFAVALPIILALSAIGWLAIIQAARLLRAAVAG